MSFDDSTDATEAQVTRVTSGLWMGEFRKRTGTEIIVVGDGPSGLVAAKELAERGVDVTTVEKNNYLSGSFRLSGLLVDKVTVRDPAQRIPDELGVSYEEGDEAGRLYVADGPYARSVFTKVACDVGTKIQSITGFTDIVLCEDGRVGGVVMSWTLAYVPPYKLICIGPIAVESDLVLDMTGHGVAVLSKLSERGVFDMSGIEHTKEHNTGTDKTADGEHGALGHDSPGRDSMRVLESKNGIVDATGVAHPGVVASSMTVATAHHLSRMGSTFDAILFSGRQAAQSCPGELDRDTPDVNIFDPAPADD